MVEWGPFGASETTQPAEADGGETVSKDAQARKALEQQLEEVREERDEAVARADRLESKLADERAKRGRLRDAIEEIAASANEVATTASGAADHGQSAQESATEALAELDSLTDHAAETTEKLDRLDEQVTAVLSTYDG